jgi:hypothetical protein
MAGGVATANCSLARDYCCARGPDFQFRSAEEPAADDLLALDRNDSRRNILSMLFDCATP